MQRWGPFARTADLQCVRYFAVQCARPAPASPALRGARFAAPAPDSALVSGRSVRSEPEVRPELASARAPEWPGPARSVWAEPEPAERALARQAPAPARVSAFLPEPEREPAAA